MSLFSRFFGKKHEPADQRGRLIANEALENPIGLQVLLQGPPRCDPATILGALRSQKGIKNPRCEFDAELDSGGTPVGLIGWGKHVVKVVGFDAPMPESAVENCVSPSHYPDAVKAEVRAHDSHLLLWYGGYESDVLEQYVALAVAAAAAGGDRALAVLNESARTSLPAKIFREPAMRSDMIEMMRHFPKLMLFCGFMNGFVEGVEGVWMRTFGAHEFGVPDLAIHAKNEADGRQCYETLENLFEYLRTSKNPMLPGHTMQLGDDEFLRCRAPMESESHLSGGEDLLVLEVITKDQINKG